MTHYLLSV